MIHHVALEVREADVPDEVAFWALLGFREVDPPPGLRERATWVQRGAQQVHLFLADDPVVPTSGHVAVVDPDVAEVVARVREAGHEADERARHWGAERWFLRSPAGHRVELMAAPPA